MRCPLTWLNTSELIVLQSLEFWLNVLILDIIKAVLVVTIEINRLRLLIQKVNCIQLKLIVLMKV